MASHAEFSLETRLVHGSFHCDKETGATRMPIHLSAGFQHETAEDLSNVFHGREYGYVYSRMANPTVVALEQHINDVEEGRAAIATSSGMAAMSVLIDALAAAGDHIISSKSIFGGTYYLLKEVSSNQNIEVSYVETCNLSAYEAEIKENTKAIFCESIGNPKCDVPDLKALAMLANKYGIPLVVDATVTTPYLMSAKDLGVHVLWHSATKWISGSGSSLGGVIVDLGNFDWRQSKSPEIKRLSDDFSLLAFIARCKRLRSNKGCILSPVNAFMLAQGLEHLALRMQRHCENALTLAEFLVNHKAVKSLSYPGLKQHPNHAVAKLQFSRGFSALLSFRVKNRAAAFEVINTLKLAKNLANLGDAKTLIIHPSSTIYRELKQKDKEEAGVYDDLLRVSVGLEDSRDIIYDFEQALEAIK